jgi:hypothetical protein
MKRNMFHFRTYLLAESGTLLTESKRGGNWHDTLLLYAAVLPHWGRYVIATACCITRSCDMSTDWLVRGW